MISHLTFIDCGPLTFIHKLFVDVLVEIEDCVDLVKGVLRPRILGVLKHLGQLVAQVAVRLLLVLLIFALSPC